jgi:Tol biopolymer transport system component
MDTLKPGDQLGPYKIDALIGQGGMGSVCRGTDTRLGRPVAIKVSSREFSDRFEREARAISALNHPNICTLYDVGPNYLVMELVEGETLSHALRQGPMPIEKAMQYSIQIADALDAAHARGVIHRDLKPGNIMITRNGVKVLDFGLAKLSAEKEAGLAASSQSPTMTDPITRTGAVLGTLFYMAPEQVEGKEANERSDIFAFGAVMFEMLTGRRAFDGDSQNGVMAAILKDQPEPIHQWQPRVPRAFERIIKRCMEKKPADRWHSAHDLKQALELIDLEASPSTASSGSAAIPAPARRALLWPAMAAMVLIVAALVWTLWPRNASLPARVTRFEAALPQGVVVNPNNFYVIASPDGTKLAFIAQGNMAGIWVRDLDSVEARLLPGTEGAVSPVWSPDSKSIAFGMAQRLMRVNIGGGGPQVLCESVANVGSGMWTPDGEIIFGSRGTGPGLQRVPASGGVPKLVTAVKQGFHTLPSLLPDGRHFLFLQATDSNETRGIYLGSLDAKPEEQPMKRVSEARMGAVFVRSSFSGGGHLFFVSDRTLMAQPFDTKKMELVGDAVPVVQQIGTGPNHAHFNVTASGLLVYRTGPGQITQLSWRDRQGKVLSTVGEPGARPAALAISPDESRVVLFRSETGADVSGDLSVVDLQRNTETKLTFGQKAVLGKTGIEGRPFWSADGSKIVYVSEGKILVKPATGAGEAQPLLESQVAYPSDWSRDGKYLLYQEISEKTAVVKALDLTGAGAADKSWTAVQGGALAALSPDGRWVAYTAPESGTPGTPFDVFIEPFHEPGKQDARSGKWKVSRNGGYYPRWRADGKELFFIGQQTEILSSMIEVSGGALQAAAPVLLFVAPVTNGVQWDVSRDGQRILIAGPLDRGNDTPITVVQNWEASLKK